MEAYPKIKKWTPPDGLMGCDLKVMLPQGRPVQGCEGPLMESIFVLQHPWELAIPANEREDMT
jgi:hypothetical protein